MPKPSDPLCASIQTALDLLGRPWTGLVLAALQRGPSRFSELSALLPDMGDKVLSARLKELEAKRLLVRSVDPGPPVRVTYRLTPLGARFRGVTDALEGWGRQFLASERSLKRASSRRRGTG